MIDLDRRIWTIPGELMKMKHDHIVPLSDSTIHLIEQALLYKRHNSSLLFPEMRPNRPVSENSFNSALRAIGFDKETHVFHGFRSSFSTLGREIHRFENDLIERQLAHVEGNTVRKAYDRLYRVEDRAAMMEKWSEYLDGLRKEAA